mgnify:CR=1 FL=1
MGVEYLSEVNEDLPLGKMLDLNIPILFVFGTGDRYTESSRRAVQELNSDLVSCIEIPDANHLFNRREWVDQVNTNTIEWITKSCKTLDS